jgi:transcription elongation GreA/GreB family factor
MASKVDEVLDKIPALKIDLTDIFDFKDKCIDPLAIEIITESIDYALETSVRRLESVAKINPSIRDNAMQTILPAIKALRNVIDTAPPCPTSTLSEAPLKPVTSKPKPAPKKTVVETVTEKAAPIIKKTETKVKQAPAAVKKEVKVIKEAVEKSGKTDAEILGTQTEAVQRAMKNIKLNQTDFYEDLMDELRAGKSPTMALLSASSRIDETVTIGKQFTLDYDGTHDKYTIVAKNAVNRANQVPEEAGVIKLSETSALANAVKGKKQGDTAEIELDGKKYTAKISDVKTGRMKIVEG